MKRSKTLIAGIVCGLLCALMVFLYTQTVQADADASRSEALERYGGEQLEVCVATRDIAVGEKIDASNVTTRLWVADLLPSEAVATYSEISGKEVSSPILSGEVISERRFEKSEAQWDIPQGLYALSVPAKDVQSVGGSLMAGMKVDVYATGTSTELLAREVLVLTTNIEEDESVSSAAISWVTLALEPESVQEIIAASQKMELYFVLPGDMKKEEG